MKSVKLVVAVVLAFTIGLVFGLNWSKFGSSKDTATSEKAVAVAVTAEANPFLDCITRAEKSLHENSIEVIVANGNFMASVEYVNDHSSPTDRDFAILEHRRSDFERTENLVILKNGKIATSCSNWGQSPEELAAN